MTKIWIMNHYAATMFFDKAGRHYWFADQLNRRGFNVSVFCSSTFLNKDDKIDTYGELYKTQYTDGIPFYFVNTTEEKGNGIKRLISWISFSLHLIKAAKKIAKTDGKPDVILASSVHPLTLISGLRIAKRLKVPCICEVRDLWPEALFTLGTVKENGLFGKILSWGEHWIYRNANALIFTKEGDTDHLKEEGWTTEQGGDIDLKKCHYINNGVDIDNYNRRIKENSLDDTDLSDKSTFKVIYAGTLRPTNDVGRILDAAKIIQQEKECRDVRFLIYGGGFEFENLKKRLESEAINNTTLKGFIDRKYIPYILSKSSVNLLNYSQEKYNWTRGNSSNKLFEYMASGKPIISTVHMGYSIINKYHCGVELDEDTSEALARQVISIHNMSKEERDKLGDNAKIGAEDFDFKVLTDKLVSVIEDVV